MRKTCVDVPTERTINAGHGQRGEANGHPEQILPKARTSGLHIFRFGTALRLGLCPIEPALRFANPQSKGESKGESAVSTVSAGPLA